MFFSGQHSTGRKVEIRGRSRAEESREQVLERTRQEREQRRRQKLEAKSATTIQVLGRASRGGGVLRDTMEALQRSC